MNGLAIQSILNDSERDENGKLKRRRNETRTGNFFDHFSRGRNTPVSSAKKWQSGSSRGMSMVKVGPK